MSASAQLESPTPLLFRVAASFTAEPLEEYLRFWLDRLEFGGAEISISGYNQLFQELLNPASPAMGGERGVNFFLLRLEDALRMNSGESYQGSTGRLDQIRRVTLEMLDALQTFGGKATRPSVIVLCPPGKESETDPSLRQSLHLAYDECERALSAIPGFSIVTAEQVAAWYPVEEIHDPESDIQGHVPYTPEYFAALSAALMRSARMLLHPPTKAVIVDADNTLWTGVVGEVGENGILLGPERLALQRRLLELKQRGVLLGLASKNESMDVRAAFSRPEMVLKETDFTGWKVSWQAKSESIRQLAAEWSLSPDAFVFIDDNPMECAEVNAAFPEILTITIPANEQAILPLLNHFWALDVPAVTSEDARRSEMMQQQQLRHAEAAKATTFAEFIAGLQLKCSFRFAITDDIPRVAQLTQRTNQFNATGIRRTESEVASVIAREDSKVLVLHVSDRFGDYGDVGLIIYRQRGPLVFVENFLLSCRVLGKGVEHQLLAHLGALAQEASCLGIVIPFRATSRNQPVATFLQEVCADGFKDGNYHFPVSRAAKVQFNPEAVAPTITEAAPVSRTSSIARPDFNSIAQQFSTASSIANAVATRRRRHRPTLPSDFVAPRNAAEEKLAALWGSVLQIHPIGVHDRFTDLGGTSLYATRIVSLIATEYRLRLPLTVLFTQPTIAQLAVLIEEKRVKPMHQDDDLSTSDGSVSPSEQRLWFLDQFIGHRAAYHIPTARRLHGPLRPEALERALQLVSMRHDILRASFPSEDGKPSHVISPTAKLSWKTLEAATEEEALRLAQADALKPFSMHDGPLFRCLLIRLAANDHLLAITFHHIISDGWSVGVFYQDLALAYNAALRHRQPFWPKLEGTSGGFATWMNRNLGKGNFNPHLDYWKRQLNGAPTVLQLPTDRPHPPVRSYVGAIVSQSLDSATRDGIATVARMANTTPYVVLVTAFQALLHRLSGQEEILIGTPVSGRTHTAVQSVLGCFVNTVVLRTKCEPETSFEAQVKKCSQTVVEALENQELPFEHLVEALNLPRDLSHTPLIQHVFVLQDAAGPDFVVTGINATPVWIHNQGAKFDLVLEVTPQADGYSMVLEFNSAVFDEATMQRWLGHYATLLKSACHGPSQRLHELPLITPEERTEILHGFNSQSREFAGDLCLHQWFEGIVARTPNDIALTCEGESLTYAETNRRANQLAHRLMNEGVCPETLVGLCVDRSLDLVIALLAILKAGGAYVPIDLSYPQERLSFMLQDAEAPILLTQRKLADKLPRNGARIIYVDDSASYASALETNPNTFVKPENTAYVIFTSGSTGRPKGCMVSHRNVSRLMQATESWYGFDSTDVWTLFHSTAFDFSVWEIWGALLYGGRLVIVPYLASRSPEEFYALLSKERVTVLNQTPSAFRQLINAEAGAPLPLELRYVIFGGEALEMQSLKPWFDRHGDQQPKLVNMYGITETTVHVTYRPLSASDLKGGSVIGIPIPDLQVYILDPHLQPVPIGVPGEMYVGGAGLATGYLKRPELTAERFIPDHLSGKSGGRLYKTGDLARFLPGRDIEYLGRIDHQVKIRGFRIELGEIESVLLGHPSIKEASVIPREDAPGEKRLVAYLVAHSEGAPTVETLRQHLQVHLPDYMVPAAFVFLTSFPLTGNGKLDRAALPVPEINRDQLSKAYAAPTSELEAKLAIIWSTVLKVPQVGVNDNFFELGGDSILSIHMIAQARKAGLTFTPRQLFENQTIAQLALACGTTVAAAPDTKVSLDNVPLLPIQRWFLDQSLTESHYWNQTFLFTVNERLDLDLLRQAAREVVARHEALRLRFETTSLGWKQRITDLEVADIVAFHPLNGLNNGKLAARVQEISEATQRELNYEHGPLLRLAYLDLGEDRPGRLLIAVHHLAVDGVSWGILLSDLEAAYRGEALPAVPTSFATACSIAEGWANSSAASKEKAWWAGRLPTTVPPLLPLNRDAGPNLEQSTQTLSFELNAEETQALLLDVPKVFRTRINDALLAALLLAVKRILNRNELWLHLEGHGREDLYGAADLSRTVGWFTAMFPVQLTTKVGADLGGVLRSVRDHLRSIPQNGAGFGFLRYSNTSPLPASGADLVFNYLGRLDQLTDASDLFTSAPESTGPWHSPLALRQHRHEIDCFILRNQFHFDWKFSRNLHEESDIRSLVDAFGAALRDIIHAAKRGETNAPEPADFPLVKLSQTSIDQLTKLTPKVVDLLPLSPMQELFYGAAAARISGGFDQWHSRLCGPLEVERFQAAWQEVIQRHMILRSSFHSAGLEHPVQVVHDPVTTTWNIVDWRELDLDTQTTRWNDCLKADALRSPDLAHAPLTSFTLARVGDAEWKFLWSVPDILMDGWSWPIVFGEVAAIMNGTPLAPPHSYRDYLVWLEDQGTTNEEVFWRAELRGLNSPTPLPLEKPLQIRSGRRFQETAFTLDMGLVERMTRFSRQHHVTTAAVMHAAWALLLARGANSRNIVFGTASNGRPNELPGVESMVGPFTNNLPVRLDVRPDQRAHDFINETQAKLFTLSGHQYSSISQMQDWSEVPWSRRLFDSLLVFQNYSVDQSVQQIAPGVELRDFNGPLHTNYPLMLVITPGMTYDVILKHLESACSPAHAKAILTAWSEILALLTNGDNLPLESVIGKINLPLHNAASATTEERKTDGMLPRTALEKRIAAIWQKAFGVENISVNENFFDLGGQSLLMLRVHQKLREELGTQLSIVQVFQHPTIASLAKALEPPAANPASPTPVSAAQSLAQQARNRAAAARAAMAKARGQS